ncbi:MAG TPA: pitrilysin family protein [Roseivirga sp.]
MLDRSKAPRVHPVNNIKLPDIEKHSLSGGGFLYYHREHNSSAFKLEIVCKAGNINAKNATEAQLGLKILGEGTINLSGLQLSNQIDSLGSFIEFTPGFDHSSISIYGLKKYFKENLKLLSEILYKPAMDSSSLKLLKEKEQNKLRLNFEKSSYLSSVNLRTIIFGNHPYGFNVSSDDLDKLTVNDLSLFHSNFIKSFDIYLSGDISAANISEIKKVFFENHSTSKQEVNLEIPANKRIEHRDAKFVQSSIKLGKRLFNRTHPDYFKLIVTNELFGGFFGSRLMKNIREEKGYTYGIYSALYPLNDLGYFLISTDVKAENEKDTLQEIEKELSKLSSEIVSAEELETVKNYMIGSFINSFNSPFAPITKFKTVNCQNLTLDFYANYIERIKSIQPDDIRSAASQYLQFESLAISIAGA